MWKDFFYYSRSERRAVYVLLVLMTLLVLAIVLVPEPRGEMGKDILKTDSVALKKFVSDIRSGRTEKSFPKKDTIRMVLGPFDPNLADSSELLRLGLSEYVVRNVIKYRQKGGRFGTPESFARIYGLTEEKFRQLKPYIRISDAFVRKPRTERKDTLSAFKDTLNRPFKYPEGTWVDANLADTVELKKIPGIGSGIARMIVDYRNRLGGFYSLKQLEEIKYITPELVKWFKLESGHIRKLDINKAGLDRLRAHPYLNFYQAKVIVEHRRKKGYIKSLSQLSLYEEFTEKDLRRLSAYVNFD